MRDPEETLQAEGSPALTQSAQSEFQVWKAPTLTTLKIEEQTLTKTGSADLGQY